MIRISNARTEKLVRKLAKQLGATLGEAVATACEQALGEHKPAMPGKIRRKQLDKVLAEIWKQHPLPKSPAERSRLARHDYLYGPDGLPK